MGRRAFFLVVVLLLFPRWCLALSEECQLAREIGAKAIELFKEDKARGLAAFIKAHDLCPDDKELTYNLGLAYYRYGSRTKAYETWKALYQKGVRTKKLLSNLSWLALELGKTEEAEAIAREGIKQFPDEGALLDTLVKVLFVKREYEEAYRVASQSRASGVEKLAQEATKYLVDSAWRKYRSGLEKEALKEVSRLARAYPQEESFRRAKDKMIDAVLGEAVDIPLPAPEPQFGFVVGKAPTEEAPSSGELLDPLIAKLKPLQPQGEAYALIVGVSDYRNIKDLRYAERDARNVCRVLVKKGFVRGDTEHVRLLLNEEASLTRLRREIRWLIKRGKLHPEARIFFYFSGHGAPVIEGGRVVDGLLLASDAYLEDLEGTGLRLSELKVPLASLRNREVLAVVDACFTGQGRSVSVSKPAVLVVSEDFLRAEKPLIVSAKERPAGEFTEGRQGAFTYFFLKGLLGEAEGLRAKDGWVDAVEAFRYARKWLLELGFDQDPVMIPEVPVRLVRVR